MSSSKTDLEHQDIFIWNLAAHFNKEKENTDKKDV